MKHLQVPLNSAAVGKAVQRKTETFSGASETVLPRNAEILGLLIPRELNIIMEIELNFFSTYIYPLSAHQHFFVQKQMPLIGDFIPLPQEYDDFILPCCLFFFFF